MLTLILLKTYDCRSTVTRRSITRQDWT